MVPNGWFPKLRMDGAIVSGNKGIWVTLPSGFEYQHSAFGTTPIWGSLTLNFNRDDGTTAVGNARIVGQYNEMQGSESGNWAGFYAPGQGRVDRYNGPALIEMVDGVFSPRFMGPKFGYLKPYQAPDNQRLLLIDGVPVAGGAIMDWKSDHAGTFFVYMIATGVHSRQIKDSTGAVVSIRDDEYPIQPFLSPGQTKWIVTGTNGAGLFVRPLNSSMGYQIAGDPYFPDARMFQDRLRVVASTITGVPLFNNWIDFNAPRKDLSKV